MNRIEEIEAREKAATDGPWKQGRAGNMRIYGPDGMGQDSGLVAQVFKGRENTHFIAHSRQDIPWLLGMVKRMKPFLHTVALLDPPDWCVCSGHKNHDEGGACKARALLAELEGK